MTPPERNVRPPQIQGGGKIPSGTAIPTPTPRPRRMTQIQPAATKPKPVEAAPKPAPKNKVPKPISTAKPAVDQQEPTERLAGQNQINEQAENIPPARRSLSVNPSFRDDYDEDEDSITIHPDESDNEDIGINRPVTFHPPSANRRQQIEETQNAWRTAKPGGYIEPSPDNDLDNDEITPQQEELVPPDDIHLRPGESFDQFRERYALNLQRWLQIHPDTPNTGVAPLGQPHGWDNLGRLNEDNEGDEVVPIDEDLDESEKKQLEKKAPKSKAKVEINSDVNKKTFQNAAKKLFPNNKSPQETHEAIASAIGVPDDAVVRVYDVGQNSIKVMIEHPKIESMVRTFGVDQNGNRFIHNDVFFVKKQFQKGGFGLEVFSKQVANATEQGFSYIETHAARSSTMNGYYTWPLFGYDQSVEDVQILRYIREQIQIKFPGAKTVLDVMQTKAGREWWSENGDDLHEAKFDLEPNSRSQKVLTAYIAYKKAKKASEGEE